MADKPVVPHDVAAPDGPAQPDAGETQQAVADNLGWSKQKANDYAGLRKIAPAAWDVVSATIRSAAYSPDNSSADEMSATADFTERLLRELLPLTADQQVELVRPPRGPSLPRQFGNATCHGLMTAWQRLPRAWHSRKTYFAASFRFTPTSKSSWCAGWSAKDTGNAVCRVNEALFCG